jgi:hypothetical protein
MAIQLPLTVRSGRPLVLAACALLALLLSSCGKGRKALYPVTGRVLDGDNQPATGALVIFHPVGADDQDPNKPRAYVDDQGSYTLTTYEKDDGAPAGKYVVTVEWRPKKQQPFGPAPEDRLRGRYSNPKTSKLRAEVKEGPTQLEPFVVK